MTIQIGNKMETIIKKIFLLILPLILCGNSLMAQDPTSGSYVENNKYDFSQFARETWGFIKQPIEWEGNDYLKIGVMGAGTFLLMQVDEPVRRSLKKNTQYAKSFPVEFSNAWGEIIFTEVLFGGVSLYALYNRDKTAHKIAFEIAQATLYTFYTNSALKFVIGRARPFLNEGSRNYVPFSEYTSIDHQSLPSGHTAIVMALTTILSRNAKPTWLKILAYLPAAMSAVGRVYLDKHWVSDVFLGGAIGFFTATWVVDQHEKTNMDNNKDLQPIIGEMNLKPFLYGDSYGLSFTLHL
jgi:hypothetical protein